MLRHVVDASRGKEQVRNVQKQRSENSRISQDALYNVLLLQMELEKHVTFLQVVPDVVLFGYHDGLLSMLNSLILRQDLEPQSLSYDTTFKMGDFYVSVLVFALTEFEETSIAPVANMIQERKFQEYPKSIFDTS